MPPLHPPTRATLQLSATLPARTFAAGAAQLSALRHTALGGRAHATLIKGAEGAMWLITRPGFTQKLLASSEAVVQDETGMRPSAFRAAPAVAASGSVAIEPNAYSAAVNGAGQGTDGRAWVVRTFGNQSAAAFAYMCFAINSDGKMVRDWWKFNVSTDEAMAMQARARYIVSTLLAAL